MKPYTILWENQSLIAVCKAANVSSVADEKDSADLCTQLCAYTGNTVYPVHRLDRMTGGVIVYAKTTAAAAALSAQMKAHTTQKTYLAVVEGVRFPAQRCAIFFFSTVTREKATLFEYNRPVRLCAAASRKQFWTIRSAQALQRRREHVLCCACF